MIRVIYNKPQLYNPWRVIWTSILFISINYIVFISFMNVCFQNLATNQSVGLLTTVFVLIGIDVIINIFMTRKPFRVAILVDFLVLFCLILSFSLYSLFKNMVFLQVVALFKLHDILYFNVLVYNLVRKQTTLLKIYVLVKISYLIILVGHVLGCIFYAIDNYLIKIQYFGSLAENPNLYYQGSLHVFTSIYSLSEIERYVYAIYYSFALLSTVAFGDIIGHNYFQDMMVAIFLILATIGISLIIEQMYIVFRRQKTMYYELVSRLKYVSQYIKSQPKISKQFRHDLINYMINAQWKQLTSTPKTSQLTFKLEKSLFQQSVLSKSLDPLPLIIRTSFMPLLKSKYFPANYFLIDNNRLENHIDARIILNGKFNVGYTKDLIGKQYCTMQCQSFGFDQMVIRTNYLNKYLTVQLVEQAQVFVLNDDQFNLKMTGFKNYINEYLPTPIEFYQISFDEIINRNRSKHYCTECHIQGHSLVQCSKFHYNPMLTTSISNFYAERFDQKRQNLKRKNHRSKKNTSKKSFDQIKRQKEGKPDLAVHFKIIGKMFNQNNLFQNLLQKTIVNYTEQNFLNLTKDQIDSYHVWKIYCPMGKL